jgi:hypothetical protein
VAAPAGETEVGLMLRAASAITLALLCLATPARGQGPRLRTPEHLRRPEWLWRGSSRSTAGAALRLSWPVDSATIPRTYWLEGGVAGGVILGLLGSGLCRLGDREPTIGCYPVVLFFIGGGIGFPAGALIGGLFPKS